MDCTPACSVLSKRWRSRSRPSPHPPRPRLPFRSSSPLPATPPGSSILWLPSPCFWSASASAVSPCSLYSYTADTLPPFFGVIAAWGLLLAYITTGASVAGGALYYTNLLTQQFLHWSPQPLVTLMLVCAVAGYIAYRDVKLSAELMLWIEIGSVSLIVLVLAIMPLRLGFHLEIDQLHLTGAPLSSLGPALVLSMFSFVGFESATTLGS